MINLDLVSIPAVQTAGNIFLAVFLVGWGPLVWWITRSARRDDPRDAGER